VFAPPADGGAAAYESYGEVAGRDEFLYLNITRECAEGLAAAAGKRQWQKEPNAEL
jgi:hypothetical protein